MGDYSFSKNKVVWMEQQVPSNFRASVVTTLDNRAVVPNHVIVPDHKLYYASVETTEEAHYLCAFLNSRPVRTWLGGFLLGKQIATSIFSYMNVPNYDPQNTDHQRLSQISSEAHIERLGQKTDRILEMDLETELELLVNKVITSERNDPMKNKKNDKKVTNEKPASLYPLDFNEALGAFLQVKPKSKEEMDKAIKENEKKKKPAK